jgi:hypothetical protein
MNVTLFQWTFSSQNIQGRLLQLRREAAQQLYYFYSKLTPLICLAAVVFIIIVVCIKFNVFP